MVLGRNKMKGSAEEDICALEETYCASRMASESVTTIGISLSTIVEDNSCVGKRQQPLESFGRHELRPIIRGRRTWET